MKTVNKSGPSIITPRCYLQLYSKVAFTTYKQLVVHHVNLIISSKGCLTSDVPTLPCLEVLCGYFKAYMQELYSNFAVESIKAWEN